MKISDIKAYQEAWTKFVNSDEMKEISEDIPTAFGILGAGFEDGIAHFVYTGFKNNEDYLLTKLNFFKTKAYTKFNNSVKHIRTVESIQTELLIKSY